MAIACISAFPATLNPGMISCDLAFGSVLSRLGIAERVDRFNFERTRKVGPVEWKHLDDIDALGAYRAIVFWGDFQHFLNYAGIDMLRRARARGSVGRTAFLDAWIARSFLEGRPDLQRRTIVFGETIYGASGLDLAVPHYDTALRAFLANAADIQFRDPLSVALAQQLAPDGHIGFGADCAFLLDADRMLPMAAAEARVGAGAPARYAVCSFGRSGRNRRLEAFARHLAEAMDCALMPIDWLKPPRGRELDTIADNIAAVRKAQFVVTDIYHLIVTAIREGCTPVAIGWGASRGRSTMEDKKKELLLRSYFGRHLYTYIEELVADEAEALKRAQNALQNEAKTGFTAGFAATHANSSEARFGAALNRLLAA